MSVSLALRDILMSQGAVAGPFLGRQAVLHFGDWQAEHAALVEEAGLVDLSDACSALELTGPDRASFLNRLVTNKIDRLPSGAGCETFFTDAKAHVLAYARLFVRPDSLLLHTAAGQAEKILAHLDRYLIQEKVELHDRSAEWATLLLAGRGSPEVLSRLVSAPLPDQALAGIETELAANRIMLRCLEPGLPVSYLLLTHTEAAAAVWLTLREHGALPAGLQAY
jgi:glycine cleavage system aminomethyltransferase T